MLPLIGPLIGELLGAAGIGGMSGGLVSALRSGSKAAGRLSESFDDVVAAKHVTREQAFKSVAGSFGDVMAGKRTTGDVVQEEKHNRALKEGVTLLGTFAKGIAGGTVALATMPFVMHRFTESVNASNEPLRKFNGQIATSFARLEYGDALRALKTSNATSATASKLADSIDEMRDALLPVNVQVSNTLNNIAILCAKAVTFLAENHETIEEGIPILGEIKDVLDIIGENGKKEEQPGNPWVEALQAQAAKRKQPPLPEKKKA